MSAPMDDSLPAMHLPIEDSVQSTVIHLKLEEYLNSPPPSPLEEKLVTTTFDLYPLVNEKMEWDFDKLRSLEI